MTRIDGPRACRESEFDEVISLINQVFRGGTDQDIRTDYPLVFNTSGMEYMRILRVNGKVVAHVPVAPREVVASARYALESGMPGGGYIFSTSNCIYTGMPLSRYELILDVWREHGNYACPGSPAQLSPKEKCPADSRR